LELELELGVINFIPNFFIPYSFRIFVIEKPKIMSLRKTVNDIGRKLSKDYIVTINYKLPYISVTNNPSKEELEKPNQTFVPKNKKEYYTKDEYVLQSSIWFSQGEETQNLIDEIPSDVKPEYYLLWYLESAGVL